MTRRKRKGPWADEVVVGEDAAKVLTPAQLKRVLGFDPRTGNPPQGRAVLGVVTAVDPVAKTITISTQPRRKR